MSAALEDLRIAAIDAPERDDAFAEFAANARSGSLQARQKQLAGNALPEVLCGRYKIERLLGVGGMGAVYRCRDLLREQFGDPDPVVAVKVLSEDFCEYPDANALLYSEFALTARLRHPNIVRLHSFEVDADCGRAFIVLDLLKGITLDQLLSNQQGLPWLQVQEIGQQLCQALSYAHEHGVLHGDIKPSNLMLGDDAITLFDFGLGQAEESRLPGLPRLARSRFAAWTPRYAAPELLDGGELTAAADVYALACVLYELASGQHPFRRLSAKQAVQTGLVLEPAAQWPEVRWPMLAQALEFDPLKRISLAELLQSLCEEIAVPSRWRTRWFGRRA
ncbi:serine/threonine-protein kinase [Atopomonas sediminilitoris]|uniref:serine/threonine-protein kinase n=1 Tax=Atopomonas sediminilitoris TaxID=2919919 RepID=UPI001F4DA5DF|nr:serine/threonine-protein kinase [Atopomonas sediminilitoris]MCJ8170440.1 serine/threonine protein kinase [Atopomonas sediminilitoris]